MPTITLPEFRKVAVTEASLTPDLGQRIWSRFGTQVNVNFPSPRTAYNWELENEGYAGFIALSPDTGLHLQPKVSLPNIFRMLEYAYRLRSFKFLDGLYDSQSIEEMFCSLANLLALKVLERIRKGLHRDYVETTDDLPFLKGRLNLLDKARNPASIALNCTYDEHTLDIEDNQILEYTLWLIERSGVCRDERRQTVRKASRSLSGLVQPRPVAPASCVGRQYSRLNEDYRELHALCRFFLDNLGPFHGIDDREMTPFIVDMGRLFELFVAEWLQEHSRGTALFRPSESLSVGGLRFEPDLVLRDRESREVKAILDTKYKVPDRPSTEDVSQVVTYAKLWGCKEAFLIYPEPLLTPFYGQFGEVTVQSLTFRLDGDVEARGRDFLAELSSLRKHDAESLDLIAEEAIA